MNNRPTSSSMVNNTKYGVLSMVVTGLLMVMLIYESPVLAAAPKRAAIVIAPKDYSVEQFKELEKAFDAHRIEFNVVSTKLGEAKSGDHVLMVDQLIKKIDVQRFDAVVFVGGFGAIDALIDNENALLLSQQAAKKGKVVAGS